MIIKVIKTKKFIPPKDNLADLINPIVPKLKERSIVVITSKVVAICEGRCVLQTKYKGDKKELAKKEAEFYLEQVINPNASWMHTIKKGLLVGSAGVDKSNSGNYFTLWPKDPSNSAKKIYKLLKEKTGVKDFGVVITDSHTLPFRRGLLGFSIAYFGFKPLIDDRGKKDLFGYEMHLAQRNIPDTLAAAAVFIMGESGEQTPIAIVTDLPKEIEFLDKEYKPKGIFSSFEIEPKEDIYWTFYGAVNWKKGGGGIE